jgi:ABC-type lipoprotein export system ATPase subunit
MLKLKNVSKKYAMGKNLQDVIALDNVSLDLPDSGLIVILGKSGSGKTTLLNMIGGIDKPTGGQIFFDGKEITAYSQKELTEYRKNIVSFVFQDFNLLKELNCIENVRLAVSAQNGGLDFQNLRSIEALNFVGLNGYENRKLNTLSGGQLQRVAIARALAKESKIILCDEPTGNLDGKTSGEIVDYLRSASKDRLVIVVTHDENIAGKADTVIKLVDGSVSDIVEQSREHNDNKAATVSTAAQNKGKFSKLISTVKIVLNNIFSIKFTALFSCVLLIAVFALFNVFYSMSQYDKQRAFVNTLRTNGNYLLQITKYIESAERYIYDDEVYFFGTQIFYEDVGETDAAALKQKYAAANFYSSYYLNKNFSDFSNAELGDKISLERKHLIRSESVELYAFSFRDAIAFGSFSDFKNPLLYGRLPTEPNEILIYDYMADSLIHFGALNCNKTADAVGAVLSDKDTGFSMKIAGILKSDYKNLLSENDPGNTKRDYSFSYLTSLQSIICYDSLIESLKADKNYISVIDSKFITIDSDYNITKEAKYEKSKLVQVGLTGENLANAIIDPEVEALDWLSSAIISKKDLSDILNVDANLLSDEEILAVMPTIKLDVRWFMYDKSLDITLLANSTINILAVVDEDIPFVAITNFGEKDNNFLFLNNYNSEFRSVYLNLSSDWAKNENLLNNFVYPTHSEKFYLDNPDYFEEGWCSYNSYDVLIAEADYYLSDVKDVSADILLFISIAAILGLIMFSFNSIKFNSYKIGVFKCLGFSNTKIGAIFILQISVVALTAFILSIPLAHIVLNRVNFQFVKDINTSLLFYNITAGAVGMTALLAILAILLAFIPLIKLYITPPVKIIKNNR